MAYITIGYKFEDSEMEAILKDNFSDDIRFVKSKGFDGFEALNIVMVPITALTIQIIDFFKTHFAEKTNTGRVIFINGKIKSIEGYNANDVVKILREARND